MGLKLLFLNYPLRCFRFRLSPCPQIILPRCPYFSGALLAVLSESEFLLLSCPSRLLVLPFEIALQPTKGLFLPQRAFSHPFTCFPLEGGGFSLFTLKKIRKVKNEIT